MLREGQSTRPARGCASSWSCPCSALMAGNSAGSSRKERCGRTSELNTAMLSRVPCSIITAPTMAYTTCPLAVHSPVPCRGLGDTDSDSDSDLEEGSGEETGPSSLQRIIFSSSHWWPTYWPRTNLVRRAESMISLVLLGVGYECSAGEG